jgi:hypothetical protein
MPDNPNPTPSHPDFQKPPAVAGESRPAPIYMDPSAYQAMLAERDELLQFKAGATKERDRIEAERIAALAKAGQVEEALTETRKQWEAKHRESEQKYQQVETSWLTEKKTAAIAEALNGREFAGTDPAKTAALVRRLLADEVEAARDSQGLPIVFDRATRRPATEYLRERLEAPEFALFFKASNRGGAGSDGTRAASTQQSNDPTGDYMRMLRERREAAISDPSRVFAG